MAVGRAWQMHTLKFPWILHRREKTLEVILVGAAAMK